MPKDRTRSVTIEEWDGDRSSACGGFNLVLNIANMCFVQREGSYNTQEQRKEILERLRTKGKTLATELNVPLQESIYS